MKRLLLTAMLLAAAATPALADNVCPFVADNGNDAVLLDEHSNLLIAFLAGREPLACEIAFLFGIQQMAACDGMAFIFSIAPAAPGEEPVLRIGDKSTGPAVGSIWRQNCDFDPEAPGQR